MFAYISAFTPRRLPTKATDLLKDHDTVKKMFGAFEKMGDKAQEKR